MTTTVVIGGGIAGLAVSRALASDRRVILLEREPLVGTHSSARNAQIWLPTEDDETTGPLARRSAELLTEWLGDEGRWLRREGAVVLMDSDRSTDGLIRGAHRGGLTIHPLTTRELAVRRPALRSHLPAFFTPEAGVFEPHVMITTLLDVGRAAGVDVRLGLGARAIEANRRVRAVVLDDGTRLPCDEVVLAAGAWVGGLGRSIDATVPLVPLRRHLVVLDADPRTVGGIVWSFADPEVYFRPESGGVLACPCDEEPFQPCLPPRDMRALEWLASALSSVAPELNEAAVRTSWACLRTYAHDRELVLGPDPRVEGLAWAAGLGGRGMTVGVAAGELCASAMRGRDDGLIDRCRPDRSQPRELVSPSAAPQMMASDRALEADR